MNILNYTIFSKRLKKIKNSYKNADTTQKESLLYLLNKAKDTEWGKKYGYKEIKSVQEYQKRIPIQSYDEIKPLIDRIVKGEQNIIWNSKIKYFAKSSGTTNDKSKFIPISNETLHDCHFRGGKDVLLFYNLEVPNTKIFKGKTLTLGGSFQTNNVPSNTLLLGDLSAILIENIPFWTNLYRTPPAKIALINKWEEKVKKIIDTTLNKNIVGLAGVPSWFLSFIDELLQTTGKENILQIWPKLELFIHGGVNFSPYKEIYKKLIPSESFNYMETYNASEGFFGIQDDLKDSSMMLMIDYGIFYEFVLPNELEKDSPKVYTVENIELNTNYAIIISTNSGLWRYIIGDTVIFTSKNPLKFIISGRTKHFINAFGEELIIDNAEKALQKACNITNARIKDYTAAPIFMNKGKQGRHQWLIEFEKKPSDINQFTIILDKTLQSLNSDYEAKRHHNITMELPEVLSANTNLFYNWLKQKNKLGGQNKIPRLSNNRKIIEEILTLNLKDSL